MSDPVELCTKNRRCSATGLACEVEDRACNNEAASRGLQVICEDAQKRTMVWCPPDTARSDSPLMWVLLAFAMLLAVGGSIAAWLVLRKKA